MSSILTTPGGTIIVILFLSSSACDFLLMSTGTILMMTHIRTTCTIGSCGIITKFLIVMSGDHQ